MKDKLKKNVHKIVSFIHFREMEIKVELCINKMLYVAKRRI